ncbi:putative large terminase subunit [uncultured Mediterranean phage]|nr:putative large terminase subunit [uncultured Mediterranean phage]
MDDLEEIFFGGAAGPGKSAAILAAAAQYLDVPDYSALILRRNFPDLAQPGGLIDMSHEWWDMTDAVWNQQLRQWRFPPHNNILMFGHMDDKSQIKRYKGGEYQFIGIDEMTDFEKREAMFLHSRLRRRKTSKIPLRFRGASNPGGVGHEWVKERYVSYTGKDRLFIPATLDDNPHIDKTSYLRSLDRLDPVTRERLLKGDWEVTEGGAMFNRAWFNNCFIEEKPVAIVARVRSWDLAATTGEQSKCTAGVRMSKTVEGFWVIEDVINGKWNTGQRDGIIYETAQLDGPDVKVIIEQEPGSGGIAQVDHLIRFLAGFRVEAIKASGDKFVRAGAFASQCQAGNVRLVRGPWNSAYIDQLHNANPDDEKHLYLDMMDATSGAFNYLIGRAHPGWSVETEDPEDREERLWREEAEWKQARNNENIFPGGAKLDFWEDIMPE